MITKGKYFLGLLFVLITVMSGCKKDDSDELNKAQDHQEIQQYVDANSLSGQFTDSGLYYVILDAGGTEKPTLSSTVTVSYDGFYLHASPLDNASFFVSPLNNLIEGWKEGIPKIGKGGKIKLIIPSHLAYGNGILIFDVDLHYFS